MNASKESPWCTRQDAAAYLGFEDVETVDSRLTASSEFQEGKLRYRAMSDTGRTKIRVWRADVMRMLPPFKD